MTHDPPDHDDVVEPNDVADASPKRGRTCVGCGVRESLSTRRRAVARVGDSGAGARGPLVRLVLGTTAEGSTGAGGAIGGDAAEIVVDSGDSSFGRGAHVHADPLCIAAAAARGLAKSFRAAVRLPSGMMSAQGLGVAVRTAFERRFRELLATARRSRKLELGSDAVSGACAKGRGYLVIVAVDAAQAAQLTEVRRAVAEGRALACGTKDELGRLLRGRPGSDNTDCPPVAVVAITDARLARAVREAGQVVDALGRAQAVAPSGEGRHRSKQAPRGPAKRGSNGFGTAAKLRGSNDSAAESGSPDVVE